MQRYKYCAEHAGKYKDVGAECRRKAGILAERMRDHADQCTLCDQNDYNFYGVD